VSILLEELNTFAITSCEQDTMKLTTLFSALTGLRHCDIQSETGK
jgi:hypothetical protein